MIPEGLTELRKLTGASMHLCIEALKKFNGNIKECQRWLREKKC